MAGTESVLGSRRRTTAPTRLFLLTNLTSRITRQIIFITVLFWFPKIIPRWNFPGKRVWSFVEKGCGIILGILEMYLSPCAAYGGVIYSWLSHEDEVLPQMFGC